MAEQSSVSPVASPVAVARAFSEAWTRGDMETAVRYVGQDVVFDGPMGHVEGKATYIESLVGLRRALDVTGARIVAVYGDDTQALIMYELLTSRFGALLCAKLLDVRDGTIHSDRLTFDSYSVRKGQD